MALAKFGAIVTDVRGKLGGHVFQGNGFTTSLRTYSKTKGTIGKYRRTEVIGSQSALEAHNVVRAEWQALSDAERQQWGVLANQFLLPNKFGDNVALSGFALFTRNITALYYSKKSTSVDPFAATNVVPSVPLLSVELDIPGQTLTFDYDSSALTYGKIIYVQRATSFNQRIYPSKLLYLQGVASFDFSPFFSYLSLLQQFFSLEVGEPLQFGMVVVNDFGFYTFKKTTYVTYV